MRIRDFYDIYRKEPIEKKLDLLIQSVQLAEHNERQYDEFPHAVDREYWLRERDAMYERARWLRWQIIEDTKGDNNERRGNVKQGTGTKGTGTCQRLSEVSRD